MRHMFRPRIQVRMVQRPTQALSFLRRTAVGFTRSYHGHFSTRDGRFWNRKLHGIEDFFAALANNGAGYGHVSVGASVLLNPSISPVTLSESARKAWIRLRYYAPLIALRTQNGGEQHHFFLTYESSKTSDVAEKWARDTIKWEREEMTLDVRDLELKETWWGTDDHSNMQLHIGPGTAGRLHFMLLACHWAIDARLVLPLLDKFLAYFVAEVEGKSQPLDELKWGDEIKRLPPALIEALDEKYRSSDRIESQADPSTAEDPSAHVPVIFQRPVEPLPQTTGYSTVSFPIVLTKSETDAFHEVCKSRKYSVTPVVNSILVLADVETALWVAVQGGIDKFKEMRNVFESADLFAIPTNSISLRSAISPEYYDLDSPRGSPGVASGGFPTMHDMNAVRKSIRLSEEGQIHRDMSDETFWNGVVANADAVMEPGRVIPKTLFTDQNRYTAAQGALASEAFAAGILSTSIGDIDKLGHLNQWRSSTATERSALVIERLILSVRMPQPTIACTCYQWDGQFTLHLQGSSRFHNQDMWQYFGKAVESRVRHILGTAGRVVS